MRYYYMRLLYAAATSLALLLFSCAKDDDSPFVENKGIECEVVNLQASVEPPVISDEYLVTLTPGWISYDGASYYNERQNRLAEEVHSLLQNLTVGQNAVLRHVYTEVFTGFSVQTDGLLADALRRHPAVEQVVPATGVSLFQGCTEEPVDLGTQEASVGVQRIGAANGAGKTAWVLDTGIDPAHQDLQISAGRSRDFSEGSLLPDIGILADWEDGNGHGTHVAGIIGAVNNEFGVVGVAYGCNLVAVKVLADDGEGSSSDVIEGLDYVFANGNPGDVVNLSLGGSPNTMLDAAVQRVASRGIFVAIAAGNDSEDAGNTSPARVNAANVYTVSAFGPGDRFASFSNFGNPPVDYAEPGVNILSTAPGNQYVRMSGTSMAAPHLAGILLVRGSDIPLDGKVNNDPDGTRDVIGVQNVLL